MNVSNILLCSILCILLILFINTCFNNEFLTNNLPNNNIVAMGDSNLLIPTSDQVYNPNDKSRTSNEYSHQETSILNNKIIIHILILQILVLIYHLYIQKMN
jgi:hypothetical protein